MDNIFHNIFHKHMNPAVMLYCFPLGGSSVVQKYKRRVAVVCMSDYYRTIKRKMRLMYCGHSAQLIRFGKHDKMVKIVPKRTNVPQLYKAIRENTLWLNSCHDNKSVTAIGRLLQKTKDLAIVWLLQSCKEHICTHDSVFYNINIIKVRREMETQNKCNEQNYTISPERPKAIYGYQAAVIR